MSSDPSLSAHRVRSALCELAGSIDFLNSAEGHCFLEGMRTRLVPRVLAEARRMGVSADWLCGDDVLHTAIVRLCENEGRAARYAAASLGDPWAYLEQCLRDWTRQQWGTRCNPLEESLLSTHHLVEVSQHRHTAVDTAITRAFDSLKHCIGNSRREEFLELLTWLANNPPQRRSYEAVDRAAAAWRFQSFTMSEIASITNIVWGGRPRYRETSLLAAYLLDENFRPSDSPSHARALLHFKRSMSAAGVRPPQPEHDELCRHAA